jgi:hypothetical protein
VLLLDARPRRLLGRGRLAARRLGERGEVLRVAHSHGVRLAARLELLDRVLPHGLEHREADGAGAPEVLVEQALGHERRNLRPAGVAHCGRAVDAAAAREHGQPCEQHLLVRLQELVAPVDRRAERPVADGEVACAVAGELQPSGEELEHLGRGVLTDPCGRELDRKRETVEVLAQLRDLVGLLARTPEARRDRARPGREQLHRIGQRQRPNAVLVLAGKAKRRPAGDEERQARSRREQFAEQRRRLVDTLEVVQQQDEAPVGR